jgi:hypothetical protein
LQSEFYIFYSLYKQINEVNKIGERRKGKRDQYPLSARSPPCSLALMQFAIKLDFSSDLRVKRQKRHFLPGESLAFPKQLPAKFIGAYDFLLISSKYH